MPIFFEVHHFCRIVIIWTRSSSHNTAIRGKWFICWQCYYTVSKIYIEIRNIIFNLDCSTYLHYCVLCCMTLLFWHYANLLKSNAPYNKSLLSNKQNYNYILVLGPWIHTSLLLGSSPTQILGHCFSGGPYNGQNRIFLKVYFGLFEGSRH